MFIKISENTRVTSEKTAKTITYNTMKLYSNFTDTLYILSLAPSGYYIYIYIFLFAQLQNRH